jgi:hypothetical protein
MGDFSSSSPSPSSASASTSSKASRQKLIHNRNSGCVFSDVRPSRNLFAKLTIQLVHSLISSLYRKTL